MIQPKQINNIIININNAQGLENNKIQVDIQNDRVEVTRKENNLLEVNQKKMYVTLSRLSNSNSCVVLYTFFAFISLLSLSFSTGMLIVGNRLYILYIIEALPYLVMLSDVYVRIYLSVCSFNTGRRLLYIAFAFLFRSGQFYIVYICDIILLFEFG